MKAIQRWTPIAGCVGRDEGTHVTYADHVDQLISLATEINLLRDELRNIANAKWREFDGGEQNAAYEFVIWAQSRSRHTLTKIGADITSRES